MKPKTNFKNLKGKRFGRLLVKELLNRPDKRKTYKWLCDCDCGNTVEVYAQYLNSAETKSCGCLREVTSEKNLRDEYEAKRVNGVAMHLFNDKPSKNNTTGFRGVYRYKTRVSKETRYEATIVVDRKRYTKGGFLTPEEAYYKGRLVLEELHLPKTEKQ